MPKEGTKKPLTREQIRAVRQVIEDFRAVRGDVPRRINSAETDANSSRLADGTQELGVSLPKLSARR